MLSFKVFPQWNTAPSATISYQSRLLLIEQEAVDCSTVTVSGVDATCRDVQALFTTEDCKCVMAGVPDGTSQNAGYSAVLLCLHVLKR